jgi:hypothetical protein
VARRTLLRSPFTLRANLKRRKYRNHG